MYEYALVVALATATQLSADSLEDSLAGKPPWRRLFLDAMVVEEQSKLSRVFHSARKYERNPVITKDKPWEGWGPYLYGTVMWDGGKLRMWYQCIEQGDRACYAESSDGLRWMKPELNLVEFEGSKANNLFVEKNQCHIPSVIRVRDPKDPEQRWFMLCHGRQIGAHAAFSPDGLNWAWHESTSGKSLFETFDVINAFWDPYNQRYTATYKTVNRRHRAVGIALSEDGVTWTKPVQGAVFGADDLDPDPTQIYGMPVFPYQGMYIGLPWIYHSRWIKYGKYTDPQVMYEAQVGSPCTVDVQMAWSWDLISWTRTPKREPFIALGPAGSFDCCQIYTARAPVIVGDELWFYYGGFNKLHDQNSNTVGAIGLAKLRLDGFCSMRARSDEGWFISRREVFRTPKVIINAATTADGYVTAELLDRNNNVIEGFSREECILFTGDSVRAELSWKTKAFSQEELSRDRKIRFYMKNADLYSYLPADIDTSLDTGRADYGVRVHQPRPR